MTLSPAGAGCGTPRAVQRDERSARPPARCPDLPPACAPAAACGPAAVPPSHLHFYPCAVSASRPCEPILHVDMDAFYASVEVRRDPSLAGRPVLVGGTGGRGVVASASYEARAYGIRSAMSMAEALRRCRDAVVIAPDPGAYAEASEQLRAILESATPLVEPLSLDEAFCDVGGAARLLGQPVDIARQLRARIRAELGLVASVGVAPNKFLAKLGSAKAKPDGLLHLRTEDIAGFLPPLPVRDLWGVGAQTAARLAEFGIHTIGDLAATPQATLTRLLGAQTAVQLAALARGEDRRAVVVAEPVKVMSGERTFDHDVDDPAVLTRELLRLADTLGARLRRGRVAARTVVLKVRYANFQTVTRSRTLAGPTDEATVLHRQACALLTALHLQRVRVRLIGLGAHNLVPAAAARQLDLLDGDRWRRVEQAGDAARARFGAAALTRGALLDDDEPPTAGRAATEAPGVGGPETAPPDSGRPR